MEQATSDLVAHFRLDAKIYQDHTIIVKRVRGKRNAKKEEKWVRSEKRAFGEGGFGQVWLEHEEADPSNVRAVKVIRKPQKGQDVQSQYERELYALAALSKHHDTVAEFFGWWEDQYDLFLAMEYLPHRDLTHCIDTALPESEVKDIVSQILEAVQILHGMDIIHRDLKPQNILVAKPGPRWWVKIGDFGISRRISSETTHYTRQVGTSAFMAPEVVEEDSDKSYTGAVDIWAVGCIAYCLLTLRNLFADRRAARKYSKGKINLDAAWQLLSEAQFSSACTDFLRSLTSPRPESRPSATQALQSDWIKSLVPPKDDESSESGDNTDTETYSSPFKIKNPFQPASFMTVRDSEASTAYRVTSVTEKLDPGSSQTVKPPPVPPKPPLLSGTAERNLSADSASCNARCKCAICTSCSWKEVANSSRAEYVMQSCGGGCFGAQPLCEHCLLSLDAGIYACPRCHEVPEETYTRNRHQASRLSGGSNNNTATAKTPEPAPKPQNEPPKVEHPSRTQATAGSSSATTGSPTPLSQQSTLVTTQTQASATTEQNVSSLPTTQLKSALDELSRVLGDLAVSKQCRVCNRSANTEFWTCMACKDAGRADRACLNCVPRLKAEYKVSTSGTLVRTCGICKSLRCYLLSKQSSGVGGDPLSLLGSALCVPTCKCDTCGTCAIKSASHWKCGLCKRPRCATCANVPVMPIPWCSNTFCNSEMLSLAASNQFLVLAAPTTTVLLSMFRRPALRPLCLIGGCSCDGCGECSLRLYTYRCVVCVPNATATSRHICQHCIRAPLLINEQPMCPDCMGTRFRVYSPRA